MAEEELLTGKVALNLKGVPLELEFTVPADPVKPRRLLPIFQNMASSMSDSAAASVEAEGKKISCKAHCGACCRQPVPISEIEIYHIADLVEAMPEPRRSEIKARFASAVDHFRRIGWFDRADEVRRSAAAKDPAETESDWTNVVLEYFYEGIPCPFLEDESCSIHADRPVICREHLVTSPAEQCAKPSPPMVREVELLVEPSTILDDMAGTAGFKEQGIAILIRSLELAEKYPESAIEMTGPDWMSRFFSGVFGRKPPPLGESEVR